MENKILTIDELKNKILNEIIVDKFPSFKGVEPIIDQIESHRTRLRSMGISNKPLYLPAEYRFKFIKNEKGNTNTVIIIADENGLINKVIYSK